MIIALKCGCGASAAFTDSTHKRDAEIKKLAAEWRKEHDACTRAFVGTIVEFACSIRGDDGAQKRRPA